ncbi:MAG: cell division protein FtsA [Candidatus Andersenbacteria bacterium]
MPKDDLLVGLDIGSSSVRVVIGKMDPERQLPSIVGLGEHPAGGIRKGVVVDLEEAVSSISGALEKAERMVGSAVEAAFVSVSADQITSQTSKGVIAVAKADGEITEDDVTRAIEAAQAVSMPPNQEILHIIPRAFNVDDQKGVKDPVGMTGVRLEVEALIIYAASNLIKNTTKAIFRAGVDIEDLVLAPLAAAQATLTKRQKELGVALVDIGGATTGIAVFEEGELLYSTVLPIGGGHVTNDIAIGLRTSVDVAEKVKVEYGFANPAEVGQGEEIDLSKIDPSESETVAKKHVAEIIEARLAEIFEMVDHEFKRLRRSGKLPAGVVLSGAAAKMPGMIDVAKKTLKLPVQVGFPKELPFAVDKIDDPAYATAVGLVLWAADLHARGRAPAQRFGAVGNTVGKLKGWFKSLLP